VNSIVINNCPAEPIFPHEETPINLGLYIGLVLENYVFDLINQIGNPHEFAQSTHKTTNQKVFDIKTAGDVSIEVKSHRSSKNRAFRPLRVKEIVSPQRVKLTERHKGLESPFVFILGIYDVGVEDLSKRFRKDGEYGYSFDNAKHIIEEHYTFYTYISLKDSGFWVNGCFEDCFKKRIKSNADQLKHRLLDIHRRVLKIEPNLNLKGVKRNPEAQVIDYNKTLKMMSKRQSNTVKAVEVKGPVVVQKVDSIEDLINRTIDQRMATHINKLKKSADIESKIVTEMIKASHSKEIKSLRNDMNTALEEFENDVLADIKRVNQKVDLMKNNNFLHVMVNDMREELMNANEQVESLVDQLSQLREVHHHLQNQLAGYLQSQLEISAKTNDTIRVVRKLIEDVGGDVNDYTKLDDEDLSDE